MRALTATLVLPLALLGVAACGSANQTATSALDSCLVGDWTSTSISGSMSAGSTTLQAGGGANARLTVRNDGSFNIDASSMGTVTLTGADGTLYKLHESGAGAGTVSTSNGQMRFNYASGSSLSTQVTDSQGTPLGTPSAAQSNIPLPYTCASGRSLVFTNQGASFNWAPTGSGNNGGTSPTPTASPSESASATAGESPSPT